MLSQDEYISTFVHQNLKLLTQALMGFSHAQSRGSQHHLTPSRLRLCGSFQLREGARNAHYKDEGDSQEPLLAPVQFSGQPSATFSQCPPLTASSKLMATVTNYMPPHTPHICFIVAFFTSSPKQEKSTLIGISQHRRTWQIAYYKFWLLELSYHRGRNE